MTTISFPSPVGFRLAAAAEFYAGFTPGSAMAAATGDELTLAFRLDRSHEAVVVALRESAGAIVGELAGTHDAATARAQVARMLGLDADGAAWRAVGERDPVIGRLQQQFAGFFTAAKPSPYDAATWAVIAPRLNMRQAARIKIAIARNHGNAVTLRGRVHHVFPAPAALARLAHIDGLSDDKTERLRGIGVAAAAGLLDTDRLRAMAEHDALAELQTLRGVGPWAASHIYFRGAAPMDALPTAEPRVLHGLAHAYGIASPTLATYHRLAETWRPFRMWVTILLMRNLARSDGWHAPGLARERARAGSQLARRTAGPRSRPLRSV